MTTEIPKPKAVVVCGPTGIGKTSVAIKLARTFKGEIINADSMQIYRYMDIGSAKPTVEEQADARHHLINIVDPDESFDAVKFSEMALKKIDELHSKEIFPFVTGGTGLYIKALIHGLFRDRPADPHILDRLNTMAKTKGSAFLHQQLEQNDPEAAGKIHPNDTFRIIRALEVFEATGKPISSFHRAHRFPDGSIDVIKIGLNMDRPVLYDRINRRVDMMIDEGLVEEVKGLIKKGYSEQLKPMGSIGYRHITNYLIHHVPWEDTLFLFKRDTRRYAKRQLTWFRNDHEIKWFEPSEINAMVETVGKFIKAR